MKIFLSPTIERGYDGIYQVIKGLHKWLPAIGHTLVSNIEEADIVHSHIDLPDSLRINKPIVVSNHGLYWTGDDPNWADWAWGLNINCISALHAADVVTVPSKWVRNAIIRGTMIDPVLVNHGIDLEEWEPVSDKDNYVLWNKSRADLSCDPKIVNLLAKKVPDIKFVTTYGSSTENVEVVGRRKPDEMKSLVERAGIYLSTARESGGPCFGVLEAMASEVPVLTWNIGGTSEIVVHKETGYIAKEGNIEDLETGLRYCIEHRERLGKNARALVESSYTWTHSIEQYDKVYQKAVADFYTPVKTSIIVPCHNLGSYLTECVESIKNQTNKDWECIIVNDASEDNSKEVAESLTDDRVRLINLPLNVHVSEARNIGIRNAKGKYILPLDADDSLSPDAVEILSSSLDSRRDLSIVCGAMHVTQDGNEFISGWPPENISLIQQLRGRNQLPYASMYRRKVWENTGGYRRRITTGVEDADFWTRALSFGYKADHVSKNPTLLYKIRSDSLSNSNKNPSRWIDWFSWARNPSLVPTGANNCEYTGKGWSTYSYVPKVSIVIPVGPNHESRLQTCLDSVIGQTFHEWECIVINDTGKKWFDGDYVNPYIKGFNYVRFIDSDQNNGPAWARNRGIEAAKTDLIVFLDVDDIALPNMLSYLYKTYQSTNTWVYSDWYSKTDEESEPKLESAKDWGQDVLRQSVGPIMGIYPKDILVSVGGFDEKAPGWEDWEFHLALATQGYCGVRLAHPTFVYNLYSGFRREENFSNKENLLQYITDRYSRYISGEIALGCSKCGGSGRTVRPQPNKDRRSTKADYIEEESPSVVIEYTGDRAAIHRIKSKVKPRFDYVFSKTKKRFYAYQADVDWLTRRPDMKLVGTVQQHIPILSDESAPILVTDRQRAILTPVESLKIRPELITILKNAGFSSVEDVAHAEDSKLLSIRGMGAKRVETIREAQKEWVH